MNSTIFRATCGPLWSLRKAVPLLAACLLLATAAEAAAFGFDDVAERARQLVGAAYKPPESTVSKQLTELGYDQYRDIRYRADRYLWANLGLPFEVAFFHTGFRFDRAIRVHEVEPRGVRDIEF